MTVTVYVWRFRKLGLIGLGNVGHASLRVDRPSVPTESFYLSWWPSGDDVHRGPFRHTTGHRLNFSYGNKGKMAQRNTLGNDMYHATDDETGQPLYSAEQIANQVDAIESDKSAEGRSADAKYRFNLNLPLVLNETRMYRAFQSIHQGSHSLSANGHAGSGQYSLVHQNCSTAVAWVLEVGGAGALAPKPVIKHYWTPTDIAKWCDRIVIAALRKQSGSAARSRGYTGNNLDFTDHAWNYSALPNCN
jgi:hypothetical protein